LAVSFLLFHFLMASPCALSPLRRSVVMCPVQAALFQAFSFPFLELLCCEMTFPFLSNLFFFPSQPLVLALPSPFFGRLVSRFFHGWLVAHIFALLFWKGSVSHPKISSLLARLKSFDGSSDRPLAPLLFPPWHSLEVPMLHPLC